MPMTTFPRYMEWLLLTGTIQNRREDTVMKYLDSLIQHLERSGNELLGTRPAVQRQMMLTLVKRVREAGRRSR